MSLRSIIVRAVGTFVRHDLGKLDASYQVLLAKPPEVEAVKFSLTKSIVTVMYDPDPYGSANGFAHVELKAYCHSHLAIDLPRMEYTHMWVRQRHQPKGNVITHFKFTNTPELEVIKR